MTSIFGYASKPTWLKDTPIPGNDSYEFVVVNTTGGSLNEARNQSRTSLASNEQLKEGMRVREKSSQRTTIEQTHSDSLDEKIHESFVIDVNFEGKEFPLSAYKIDEYYEQKDGEYHLSTLYQIATCANPSFDNVAISTSYGITPAFMSIIPGVGQMYKGSTTKGVAFLVSEAAAVAGIIWTENERASYAKKIIEQPKFAKEYSNKVSGWETGRNICIGVAAGIWVWNVIDAAFTKGARKLIVTPKYGSGLSIVPFIMPKEGRGISIAYNF